MGFFNESFRKYIHGVFKYVVVYAFQRKLKASDISWNTESLLVLENTNNDYRVPSKSSSTFMNDTYALPTSEFCNTTIKAFVYDHCNVRRFVEARMFNS